MGVRGSAPLLLTSLRVNDEMDESAPPQAKKAKKNVPLTCLTAEEMTKQKTCMLIVGCFFIIFVSTVDFTRMDTVKDHLKSKKQ